MCSCGKYRPQNISAVMADLVRALPFYAASCHLKYKYRYIHPKFPPDMKREVTV